MTDTPLHPTAEPALLQVATACADAAQALAIARAAVEARLAACAQILPGVRSVYHWQGAIEQADEVLCLLKTTAAHYAALQALILARHPYATPEILATPVAAVSPGYAQWLRADLVPLSELSPPPE